MVYRVDTIWNRGNRPTILLRRHCRENASASRTLRPAAYHRFSLSNRFGGDGIADVFVLASRLEASWLLQRSRESRVLASWNPLAMDFGWKQCGVDRPP